ncbi:hypothetical protein TSUD_124960 [Trifolium subterraneum]|uniref:RRM domain-containing protein n=1 Tax=Trifolium subterraneum TaxID=3900 RepID=A0A2Z6M9D5_TRISU|nr:hypothetical protein TSUD_124960 [Trifolium subterraneum]
MREKERVEREGEGSRRTHGYIHNVDQSSISFFVTNFPDNSTVEELWKVFAKYGRLGDVYIPSKVDKWGKKFAFVKFREVKEEGVLSQNLKDVWLGSFKLRINKSRFERKEDEKKKKELGSSNVLEDGGNNAQPGGSFKTALMQHSKRQEEVEKSKKSKEALEEVFQVEVDGRLLKELESSFVGKLALKVEIRRIKTILFMEGLSHISVTDMGRDLVLIFSPKVGEVEKLWNSKADWIRYYFKEVNPWLPSSFVDRRDLWVKVYGIPLHVWSENLFKVIRGKYGEFLDYDDCTASRAKLDIARIKISTSFRGFIDDPLNIMALGVTYSLRVVEEKNLENVFFQRDRDEEHEQSWVVPPCSPKEAWVEEDGVNGGSVEEVEGGSVEEEEGEVGVDLSLGQTHVKESRVLVDGDVSLVIGGNRQTPPFVSACYLKDKEDILLQKEMLVETCEEVEVATGRPNKDEVSKDERREDIVESTNSLMETCLRGGSQKDAGGPGAVLLAESVKSFESPTSGQQRSNGPPFTLGLDFEMQPKRSWVKLRSASLPPFRPLGSSFFLESVRPGEQEFSDSISLVEVQGGALANSVPTDEVGSQRSAKRSISRRGRSRNPRGGSNQKKKILGVPKFVHLMEATKEVGGKNKKKKGTEVAADQNGSENSDAGGSENAIHDGEPVTMVANSPEGLLLEVVLPGIITTPSSGLNLLLEDGNEQVEQHQDHGERGGVGSFGK